MALVIKDRIKETTTTTGTGTYSLAGAEAGFQGFSAVGDGNTCYYACTDNTDFEVGIGTFTASGSTLARTTILESSNSDAAVDWSAGSKDIFVTAPADKLVYEDASGDISVSGTVDGVDIAARDAVLTSTTTTANAAMPLAGGTFTGTVTVGADGAGHNVKLFGGTSGEYVEWDASEDTLYFPDNSRLMFGGNGTAGDLRLYTNGTNAFVEAIQTTDLIIKNQKNDQDVTIQTDNGSGGAADYFRADGSTGEALLYHYGSEKFATKSTGVDVTGDITVSGTVDGVDIAARDAVLTSTTTTANAAMPKAGGTFTGDVTLLNSGDGAFASPYLKLKRDSASPAAWDYLGIIKFLGEDGGSNETPYATMLGRIVDATGGSEDGRIEIYQMKAGTETLTYVFDHDAFQLQNEQPIKWKAHHGTAYDVFVEPATPTATRTITLPDQTGTVLLSDSAGKTTFGGAIGEEVYTLSGTALDPNNGTIQTKTLSANTTLTDSLSAGESITLMIDDGSSYTLTWPTITWVNNGGSAPTLATSGYTVIAIWKVSTTLYGALVGDGS